MPESNYLMDGIGRHVTDNVCSQLEVGLCHWITACMYRGRGVSQFCFTAGDDDLTGAMTGKWEASF